jgi:phosphoribosylaminoimidazole-succinocarboxamide synthase
MYKAGKREMYGIALPDGMKDNQKLPHPILTPTSKGDYGSHDEPLTEAEIVEKKLLTAEQWATVKKYALALFARGQELAAKRGLILADTKYEFGMLPDGTILLADEIHTPDSSRYWKAATYDKHFAAGTKPDSFDKDFVRNWVVQRCDPYKDDIPEIPAEHIANTSAVYIEAYETITGKKFAYPDATEHPLTRIRRNLRTYFPK